MKLVTFKVNNSKTIEFIKSLLPPVVWKALYKFLVIKNIPHHKAYDPHYSPWLEEDFINMAESVRANTGLKPQSLYTILHFLEVTSSLEGDVVECGVWRGGSAKLLRSAIIKNSLNKKLYLFDSFEGMAIVNNSNDRHEVGDFKDTSLSYVSKFVTGSEETDNVAIFKKGWIPQSFNNLEEFKICFAHIDLDLYQSILDALNFIYFRLVTGGIIVFDDYGYASCPGAKKAVDEFFHNKPESIFVLSTGQALLIKK